MYAYLFGFVLPKCRPNQIKIAMLNDEQSDKIDIVLLARVLCASVRYSREKTNNIHLAQYSNLANYINEIISADYYYGYLLDTFILIHTNK